MVILDTNILLYAVMPAFRQHKPVKDWLDTALSTGNEIIGITWQVATAFIRVGTNRRVFDNPLGLADVKSVLDDLFEHRMVSKVLPTENHWTIYSKLLSEMNLSGDIVMDARIAAVAIEHKATVASCDKDLRRFSDHIKIIDPMKKS